MNTAEQGDPEQALAAAMDALRRDYEAAGAAIGRIADPQRAFEAATRVGDSLRELGEEAADLRDNTVRRIWERDRLSLAALGELIGVSKARAGQLVQGRKKTKDRSTQQGSTEKGER